jgi:Mrp family chromosome partitioning ATPase
LRERAPTDTVHVLAQRAVVPDAFFESLAGPVKELGLDVSRVDGHLSVLRDEEPTPGGPYEQLAARVVAAAMRREFRRVMIASAHHGEGRTTITLNLAAALQRANKRVLVIDSDLGCPSIGRLLGIEPPCCFAEAIARGLKSWTALTRLQPGGLDVLFSRGAVANPIAVVTSNSFMEMLQLMGSYYDFVLLDSPPLLDGSHSQLLARLCDTVLLVVQPGATTATEMARAMSPLVPDDILGVVLNHVRS